MEGTVFNFDGRPDGPRRIYQLQLYASGAPVHADIVDVEESREGRGVVRPFCFDATNGEAGGEKHRLLGHAFRGAKTFFAVDEPDDFVFVPFDGKNMEG